eukprot:TRINITY_DN10000_c0_g1_i1.p1 TRINITY_DN10000_c0_g1~~TRINITY_DN10000_c0_g1_i1.p1  ORF type:complete len:109 (+),score=11.88 TRINITY_DN10000_c0_g1_i1:728-1054(+)
MTLSRMIHYAKPIALRVFMSNKYVYAQVVHVPTAQTILSAASLEAGLRSSLKTTSDREAAAVVGRTLAERMKKEGIPAVAFTMENGQRYHGKLKALLDAVKTGGIRFL